MSGSERLRNFADEAEKKLRSTIGVWEALELSKREYPSAAIILMDSSAPFDILIVDPSEGNLVAVEVKAPRRSSSSARHLSRAQREIRQVVESRHSWTLRYVKCVVYGNSAKDARAEFVE